MFNILVVEDDKNLRKLITTCLKKNNYTPFEANDGEEALDMLDKQYIDLIITDVMMPKIDGFELIKELRMSEHKLPILLITAKDSIQDKKEGFLLGADDYMVKPIELDELLMKIKALLRRAQIKDNNEIKIGNLVMNRDEMAATYNGEEIPMTVREFNILFKLLSYPKKTFTRAQIMNEFWEADSNSSNRTVDVYMTKIRDKFSHCDEFEIVTVHGLGYKAVLK